MEADLGPPRSNGSGARSLLRGKGALRLFVSVLAIAAILACGVRRPTPSAAADIGAVAYCVTDNGSAAAGMHTALYTLGEAELDLYATGTTDRGGCGVFNYVPVDQSFFITAWSEDGRRAGNSSWFSSDAMIVAPTVELYSPSAQPSSWMGVYQAQAYDRVQ